MADQTIEDFSRGMEQEFHLRVAFKESIDEKLLESLDHVIGWVALEKGIYKIKVKNSEEARSAIFSLAAKFKLPLVGLQEEKDSFDNIFHSLTKEN